MKRLILTISIALSALAAQAQFTPGAIAFLGFQADAPDAFAFVTLQDIQAGDSIFFTDNGWSGTAFFTNENTMSWKANVAVPAASVVRIQDPNDPDIPNALIVGPGTTRGKLTGLAVAGDQLFAYTLGAGGSQIPLAAFSTNGFLSVCNTSGVGNAPSSCLPSNLTLGTHAVQLNADGNSSSNPDNAFFNIPTITGTAGEILALVNNVANWTSNEDFLLAGYDVWPDWNFTIGEAEPSIVNFTVSAVSVTEGGNPVNVNFSITPALIVPKNISIQIDVTGNVTAADLVTNPAHTDGLVNVTIPANVTTFSFSVSAIAGDATEGDELSTISISSADNGINIGPDNFINMEIIEDLNTSFVTFPVGVSNYNLIEGDVLTLDLAISPVNASESTFSIEILPGNGFDQNDYATTPIEAGGLITFTVPAGQSSVQLEIDINDDLNVEALETAQFNLTGLSGNFSPGVLSSITINITDNDVPVNFPTLFINELMSANTVTFIDDDNLPDDWIEIYNAGNEPVDLAGLFMTDDIQNPGKHQFVSGSPEITTVPPGGFKIVWADDSLSQGPMHVNFTLPSTGGFLGLYQETNGPSGSFYVTVDTITYPQLALDRSYGREQDGELPWVIFNSPTPGTSNENIVGFETSEINTLMAYPNPVQDNFTIRLVSDEVATIKVHDVTGRLVWKNQASQQLVNIPTLDWEIGTYIVDVTQGAKRVALKIQVIR
jgi:hypothetical protein